MKMKLIVGAQMAHRAQVTLTMAVVKQENGDKGSGHADGDDSKANGGGDKDGSQESAPDGGAGKMSTFGNTDGTGEQPGFFNAPTNVTPAPAAPVSTTTKAPVTPRATILL